MLLLHVNCQLFVKILLYFPVEMFITHEDVSISGFKYVQTCLEQFFGGNVYG